MESGKKGESNERNNISRRFGNSFITAYSGDVKVDILVREYRCSGGTETVNPVVGNRCSGTRIPHLTDYYFRVYSLNAGFNPYTSRMDL